MTKSDKTRQNLSIRQKNAIDLVIVGKTDQEVADAIGVSRQIVNTWKNHNPIFMAELNYKRKCIWDSQLNRLRLLISRAIDALANGLENEDVKLRVSTAINTLKAVGIYGNSLEFPGSTNPVDIELSLVREAELNSLLSML